MMLGRPYKNVNPVKGFVFSYLCSLNIVFVHYTGDRNIYKKTKDILKDADHNGKITTKCLTAFLYSYIVNSFIYFFINLLNLLQQIFSQGSSFDKPLVTFCLWPLTLSLRTSIHVPKYRNIVILEFQHCSHNF